MLKHTSNIALIPAYNPDSIMLNIVRDLKNNGYTVVLVNDGSDTRFNKLFLAAGRADIILRHDRNKGKGAALKTGLRWIYQNYSAPYTVVTVDADGQHLIADTCRVTDAARRHPSTLIIGSRRLKQNAPFRSKSGNFITRIFLHALTPVSIYDTQSGLRSFTHDLIPLLTEIEGERYEYEMRMLIDVNRRGIPIKEIPIEAVYIGSNNTSHFRTVCDSARLYKVIFANADRKRDPQQSHDNHL
ncbi:MAG: glycosyltransferase family 2 protein [Ruminococcus sp.]|nr:glycosyltransferase family 2 protein [Ruminococcus sp.]